MDSPDNWKFRLFLENVFEKRIEREFDRIIPVVADEGLGKSTLMLQATWLWQDIRGRDPTVESVLDQLVWDQQGFKKALANYDRRSAIPVQDAARVLYKKDAMDPDQKEIEKDLLDSRTKEFLIMLGFQDWDVMPTMLQERRAKNLIRIPQRGLIHGYSRESLDKRVEDDEWPEPDMVTHFPSLDDTKLWSEFKRRDTDQKEKRMDIEDVEDEKQWEPQEVVDDLLENGVEEYISKNEFNDQVYVDADLIQFDYGLTVRGAKQVKKAVTREIDVKAVFADGGGTEGDRHTA